MNNSRASSILLSRALLALATLGATGLIAGWEQGVVGMKVGGRRELIIPATLGYGLRGSPPTIPPEAPLVFVIDLLGT